MTPAAPGSTRRLQPATEHLGHAPGLGGAASGEVGGLGVEDLADRADAVLVEVGAEPFEVATGAPQVAGVELEPGVDERPDQPGPDGPLVIGGVAGAEVAVVFRLVVGMAGGERTEADGGEKPLARDRDDRLPARPVEDRVGQA